MVLPKILVLTPIPLADRSGATAAALKTAAFSQLAKASLKDPFQIGAASPPGGPARNTTEIMGYTVRVDGWRYTCWFRFDTVARPARTPFNTKAYSSTYLAMGFANVRAGTRPFSPARPNHVQSFRAHA